jgi:SpoVK/Ycf46/Vps4 family AAA+-type ATPase
MRNVKRLFKWCGRVSATLLVVGIALISQGLSYGFERGKIAGVAAVGSLVAGTWVISQTITADVQTTFAVVGVLTIASLSVDRLVEPFDKLKATERPTLRASANSNGDSDSGSGHQIKADNDNVGNQDTPTGGRDKEQKQGIDASEVKGSGDDGSSSGSDDVLTSEFFSEPPEMDFDDVAGMESVKEELRTRVIEPLENPEKYEQYGLSVESGFLFHGPPGTGKTYISKALAGELGIEYAQVKGTDLISRFVGAGAENVGELFDEARDHQPCMVFIDEIDAVASKRKDSGQHQMQTQMVNQLLEEIGELNDGDEDIIVVGATNQIDRLDDAIVRSGRLSEHIEIGLPDADSRIGILDTHLDAPRAEGLDLDIFRVDTEGLNAADMEQVAVNAAREAMLREDVVRTKDIQSGIDQVQ